MPQSIYPLRILGMGLGSLAVGSVLYERQAQALHWAVYALCLWVWPHIALLLARRSANPFRAEVRNLLIDSAIVGVLVPLMHFNLLPSVVLVAVVISDKLSPGIRRLWLHSLPGMLATGVLTTLLLRPTPVLESSLPILVQLDYLVNLYAH